MNPYNLDPRNMTAEERERAAYLAGDYATANDIAERMDQEEIAEGLQSEINDLPTQEEVCEMHAKIERMQVEIESLRAAAGMIDE